MASSSLLRFDRDVIDALPTPLACALDHLDRSEALRDEHPIIVLWHACDTVELVLRLLICLAIAELHAQGRLAQLGGELSRMMDRPTLGQWRGLLARLAAQLHEDTLLHELRAQALAGWPMERFFSGDPAHPEEKEDPLRSFLALRNRIAHGAGLTHDAARDVLLHWEAEIGRFLAASLWMRDLTIVARGPDGPLLLRGLKPGAFATSAFDALPADATVAVQRAARTVDAWPMITYGVPRLTNPRHVLPNAVQIYARRSAIDTVQYTPIDSEALWSFGDKAATRRLDDILLRAQATKAAERAVGAVASFMDDLVRDGKQMIGRDDERALLWDALVAQRGSMLWLDGAPGSGKTTLMAKLAVRLIEDAERNTPGTARRRILPYRFKVGDSRCATESFCRLIEQAIDPRIAQSPNRKHDPDTTGSALKACLERGEDCVLLLDGLDEIDQIDPGFIRDVCFRLAQDLAPSRLGVDAGRVTWICAGRLQLTGRMVAGGAVPLCVGGLPPMKTQDIRAMLLDRIGTARDGLLRKDRTTRSTIDTLPATPERIAAMNAGRVPDEILAICKSHIDPRFSAARATRPPRTLPMTPFKRWIVDDDDDNEMYPVACDGGVLTVHAERVDSPFITAVAKQSDGLPIYVRCVINDVIAGGDTKDFEAHKLPGDLTDFYQQIIERSHIGDVAVLLTPLICLITVARDAITDEQLVARARRDIRYRNAQDAPDDVTTALTHLSPMLRRSHNRRKQQGFAIYHKSLRDYLDPPRLAEASDVVQRAHGNALVTHSIFTARVWLCEMSTTSADQGLVKAGPFADYVAHFGIDHLLEMAELDPGYDGVARALRLFATLTRDGVASEHDVPPAYIAVMAKRIADGINGLADAMHDDETRALAAALPVDSLLVLIAAVYETGTRKGIIRILAELHPDTWDALRNAMHSPYDMVLRVDTGEVMAALWLEADADAKPALMQRLVAMTTDPRLEEREVAAYALSEIFLESDLLDATVLQRWATAEINIERMILGEVILGLGMQSAERAARLEAILPRAQYPSVWCPPWDYHRIDLDTYRIHQTDPSQWAALGVDAGDCHDASLAASARDAQRLSDERTALLQRVAVQRHRSLAYALTPEGFVALNRSASDLSDDAKPEFEALRMLLEGPDRATGLEILKALMSHPDWRVAEAAASALERMVERANEHLSLIDDLLKDEHAHWRVTYAAIDAAYNVGGRDDFRLFESAIKRHGLHGHSRVRGICGDDFLAWLRLGDDAMQKRILDDATLQQVVRTWVARGDDCWVLEYAYLIVRLIHQTLKRDVGPWLADGVSVLFAGDRPFYACERDEVLLRIERNRGT